MFAIILNIKNIEGWRAKLPSGSTQIGEKNKKGSLFQGDAMSHFYS